MLLNVLELNSTEWVLLMLCAFLVGMSKAGVPGVSMISIPILAMVFGGKNSTGILLPILIMADLFGVGYYHRHAHWKHVLRALPWAVAGVLLAMVAGNRVNDEQFKRLIAIVIFAGVGLMIWRERKKEKVAIPTQWYFAALMGLAGGFATMIGNAAGPILAIYLLALRLPKNEFIGTAAWFFFLINVIKVPFHIFNWHTISGPGLLTDLYTLPAITLGALSGFWLVKRISNKRYQWLVIVVTVLSAILMLF